MMNVDFAGLVPTLGVQSALLTTAAYPRFKLLELEKHTQEKKEV